MLVERRSYSVVTYTVSPDALREALLEYLAGQFGQVFNDATTVCHTSDGSFAVTTHYDEVAA